MLDGSDRDRTSNQGNHWCNRQNMFNVLVMVYTHNAGLDFTLCEVVIDDQIEQIGLKSADY